MGLHQPLDAALYENDLGRRLYRDFLLAIRRALPLDLVDNYSILRNYFIMPFPGRISFGGKVVPTLRKIQTIEPFVKKIEIQYYGKKKAIRFFELWGGQTPKSPRHFELISKKEGRQQYLSTTDFFPWTKTEP